MRSVKKNYSTESEIHRTIEEHDTLHEIVKILHQQDDFLNNLENVLVALTRFSELEEEYKAGIFLADQKNKVLRLFCTVGEFPNKFFKLEDKILYGQCLCGKVASSGELMNVPSCCEDDRYDSKSMTKVSRGAYVVPLKSHEQVVGIMFLYTKEFPSVQKRNKELLLSIGGLIGDAIVSHQRDEELCRLKYELYELNELAAKDKISLPTV